MIRQFLFCHQGKILSVPVTVKDLNPVGVYLKSGILSRDVIRHDHIQVFLPQLFRRIVRKILCFGSKSYKNAGCLSATFSQFGEDVGSEHVAAAYPRQASTTSATFTRASESA